jgi:hypothetical protein
MDEQFLQMVVLFLVLPRSCTRSQPDAFSLSGDSSKNIELFARPFRVTTTRRRKWKIFQKSFPSSSSRFSFCFHAPLKVTSRIPFFGNARKSGTLNSEKWAKQEEGNRLWEETPVGVCALLDVASRDKRVRNSRQFARMQRNLPAC